MYRHFLPNVFNQTSVESTYIGLTNSQGQEYRISDKRQLQDPLSFLPTPGSSLNRENLKGQILKNGPVTDYLFAPLSWMAPENYVKPVLFYPMKRNYQ